MARFYVLDGVTHVAATPHHHLYLHLEREEILERVARLNQDLAEARVALTVLPGCEIQVRDSASYRRDFEAGRLCHLGDGTDYTLLEFAWQESSYPSDAAELVQWIRARGMTPIVAHPERQTYLGSDAARLRTLVDAGAWLQITVDSLLGNHGGVPQRLGEQLVREYPNTVLATDAHNLERCSGLAAGFDWVGEKIGAARADEMRALMDRVLAALLRS